MENKIRAPRGAVYGHQAKRLNRATLIFPVVLMTGCCIMSETIKPIADDVFKKAAFTEPLPPTAFTSDGCSLWFDGDWVECCVLHDLAYWRGGTSEERQKADRTLEECVADRGYPAMARIMVAGVRVGGVWWLPTCFRWGYGGDYPQTGPPGIGYRYHPVREMIKEAEGLMIAGGYRSYLLLRHTPFPYSSGIHLNATQRFR